MGRVLLENSAQKIGDFMSKDRALKVNLIPAEISEKEAEENLFHLFDLLLEPSYLAVESDEREN